MEIKNAENGLVYAGTLQLVEGIDYGVPLGAVLTGTAKIPSEGLQIDQAFRGTLNGPRLKGNIEGTDYLSVRPDGAIFVHAHAHIETDDKVRIAFFADGTARSIPGGATGEIRENVTLRTASPKYAWVNRTLIWATGKVDLSTGKIELEGHEA